MSVRVSASASALVLCGLLAAPAVSAQDAWPQCEAQVLTDSIVMVRVVEGRALHHDRGQKRTESSVELVPLDVAQASDAATWQISSDTDAAYAQAQVPSAINRKTKGTDFAWMVQGWDNANQRAKNHDPDHVKTHWLYLHLPSALQAGASYQISGAALGERVLTLAYDPKTSRSEAVHVNVIGYVPDTAKFAYVYHWAGDLGSLDLSRLEGAQFQVIKADGGAVALEGSVQFRAPADQVETSQQGDTPNGNFLGAEVWECDFSALREPGTYVVVVDGIGCSFPVHIGPDVYREAFRTTARGLYHNRSGIALEEPYTTFTRPAPANPKLTPGFAGKLVYTSSRWTDWKGKETSAENKAKVEAGIKGPLEVWGFYQDAGDWDSYYHHLNVPTTLLFTYEMAPKNFVDGELNIPESGNGVPDILDEAAWLPRFCHRLRHELLAKGYGTGGIGMRVCGDFYGGDERADGTTQGSWEDTRQYIASGEDHCSTMRYAGVAAHLAFALQKAGVDDPKGVDWMTEARESYAWAVANAPDNRDEYRDAHAYAAAALYRMTGDAAYEADLAAATSAWSVGHELWWDQPYGPYVHSLGGGVAPKDAELAERLRALVLRSCEIRAIETPSKRALRWGGGWSMPMLIGHQTTPWIMEGMVASTLLSDSDPAAAQRYRDAVATTCDYFLGTNSLNQTWVTGLGIRHVQQVFHMDAWYNGKGQPHPGVVPYGPWRDSDKLGSGPWDVKWPNKTVYPAIGQWPGNERWFDNRNCPLSSEFTVHQTTCWSAAVYGWMCAPAPQ
ncbi:MAG: glycoside hydrolase family 9 protein [Planctomycetota bacterium]|jgi:endoglucanase|nr:glycoside hydrolase family 9 protein [Planctomycetota bacterium]